MDGGLSEKDSPKITLQLGGYLGEPQEVEAIIDTGFTGSISIPFIKALPLGLVLFSTATFILADGSKEVALLCFGRATIGAVTKPAIFSLTKGSDVLIGTELLAKFGVTLHLDYPKKKFSLLVDTQLNSLQRASR